jgi:hypothetical protein
LRYPDQSRLALTPRQISVRRYFTPLPSFPFRGMIGPAIAVLIGLVLLGNGPAGVFIGLVLVAVGSLRAGPRIYRYMQGRALAEPKPSEEELDTWLAEAIDPIYESGFRRLDIVQSDLVDQEAPPLVVIGFPEHLPDFLGPAAGQGSDFRRPRFRLARGRDGRIRATHYDILVIYMTTWHLCTYKCVLEMETGNVISDRTREFHYRDVVSVASESERLKIQIPVDVSGHRPGPAVQHAHDGPTAKLRDEEAFEFTTSQWFRLRVSSDEIAVLVALFDMKAHGEGTDIDLALRRIRGRLREYTRLREEGEGSFDDLHARQPRRDF